MGEHKGVITIVIAVIVLFAIWLLFGDAIKTMVTGTDGIISKLQNLVDNAFSGGGDPFP